MGLPPASPVAPSLEWIGDAHLCVRLGDAISADSHAGVRSAHERLRRAGIPGLIDLTPAYTTLLLRFDAMTLDPDVAAAAVRGVLEGVGSAPPPPSRLVDVPVCYDPSLAPDLADVALRCSLAPERVVELHSGAEYRVAFIGFAPGFPYLTGLPKQLSVPRLDSPRPRVPAGSVAIAGDQAGIYPHATPGGWRIVGRTPVRLFDVAASVPSMLAMGDRIRFVPISLDEFRSRERR
jgi:inhibitor of KinA